MSGTTPLTSTLVSTWHHAHDSFSQAFPLRFAYCKQSKTGGGNGTEASEVLSMIRVNWWKTWTCSFPNISNYLTECIAIINSAHLKKFGVQSSPTLSLSALASLWICIRNVLSYQTSLCNLIPRSNIKRNSLGMRPSHTARKSWFVMLLLLFITFFLGSYVVTCSTRCFSASASWILPSSTSLQCRWGAGIPIISHHLGNSTFYCASFRSA